MNKGELIRHIFAAHDPTFYYTSADTKAVLDDWHRRLHETQGTAHGHPERTDHVPTQAP